MKNVKIFTILFMAFLTFGCSTITKEELGLAKRAPNEFMVSPRSPLTLPPEYDLRPVSDDFAKSNVKETDEHSFSPAEARLLRYVEAQ